MSTVATRHYEGKDKISENQYVATFDGNYFIKDDVPNIDINELPEVIDKSNFRDPQIVKIGDLYYMFVGSRLVKGGGIIVVCKGNDVHHLHYDFYIGPYPYFFDMLECPSYQKINGKDVFLFSCCSAGEHTQINKLKNASYYAIGELDFINKNYKIESCAELDRGDAFYAPKIIENYDVPVMIGWLNNWGKAYPTQEFGFVGSFSLPRKLSVNNNILYQYPYVISNNGLEEKISLKSHDKIDKHCILNINSSSPFNVELKGKDGNIKIIYQNEKIYLDTINSNNGNPHIFETHYQYKSATILVVLDSSSVEIFVDNGKEVISSRTFLEEDDYDFISDDKLTVFYQKVMVKK